MHLPASVSLSSPSFACAGKLNSNGWSPDSISLLTSVPPMWSSLGYIAMLIGNTTFAVHFMCPIPVYEVGLICWTSHLRSCRARHRSACCRHLRLWQLLLQPSARITHTSLPVNGSINGNGASFGSGITLASSFSRWSNSPGALASVSRLVAASRPVPCAAMCLRRSGFGLPGRWRSLCNLPACGSVECCPRNLHLPDRDSSLQHTLKLRLQLASESFPRVQWLSWLGSALAKKIS